MADAPLLDTPEYVADLNDSTKSGAVVARAWGVNKATVNKHRARLGIERDASAASTTPPTGDAFEKSSDGKILNASTIATEPWGDDEWREFLRLHGTDPDTVTYTHGVTSNPTGGFWNKLNNVRPIAPSFTLDVDWEAAQKRVRAWKLPQRIPGTGLGPEVAATVNLADMQLHKPDGDGLKGTLDRLHHGLENVHAWVPVSYTHLTLPTN